MTKDPKLENYLSALEKALGPIPAGDRADIITEIKSHVLDALEKDPNNTVENILASLGEPQIVANRYLMERGLKPVKPSRAGMIVKWLVIGFLGTIGIFVLFVVVMIWKFTPIVKVNEESGKVEILGGMINIQSDSSTGSTAGMGFPSGMQGSFTMQAMPPMQGIHGMHNFNFKSPVFNNSIVVKGSKDIEKGTDEIDIKFKDGKIEILPSSDNKLIWNCYAGKTGELVEQTAKKIKINMNKIENGICVFNIPEKIKTTVEGKDGMISVIPRADIDIKINDGMVYVHPENMEYKFDLKVDDGMISGMENRKSSDKKGAVKIKVSVKDGMIQIN